MSDRIEKVAPCAAFHHLRHAKSATQTSRKTHHLRTQNPGPTKTRHPEFVNSSRAGVIAKSHGCKPYGIRTKMVRMLHPGQQVRVNLAGMQVGSVTFHAAVTGAVGTIVRQVSENPPQYLVKLLFSFRGVDEVEVPENRIVAK
ncbi:MAG TPA: hypothetical protein VKK81_09625 [Candidatus Binatia bacterium]|nr:hypothetical protein [Candidatus Binatia bacterium]